MSESIGTVNYESPNVVASDDHALRELLSIAGPTVAQMASYTVMQFIDTWMLAHKLGPMAPTAASNAGSLSFAVIGFGFGMVTIVNTVVSQSFGRKAFDECGRYLWQGVWLALLYSIAILPTIPLLGKCFEWFHHSPEVLVMERIYVHYMILTAGFKLVQTAFAQFMFGTNRASVVMVSTIAGVAANAVAAYAMVFGKFGFAPRGVTGAALAQAIGTAVELVVLVFFAVTSKTRTLYNTFDWKFRWPEFRSVMKLGFGSGIQLIAEVAAWSLFMNWVIGRLGENAMAAMAFMLRYLIVSFLPAVGISTAVTALVGRYIGMGRPDLAVKRAHLGFKVAICYLAVCGTCYFFGRHLLIELFTHDPEVVRLGAILLVFAAFYQLFDGMYVIYCGALRGAGDTFVPAVTCALLCWGVMVFGGYGMAYFFPQLSVAGPWSVAFLYGMTLGLFMFTRFRRGGWKKIRIDPPTAEIVKRPTIKTTGKSEAPQLTRSV